MRIERSARWVLVAAALLQESCSSSGPKGPPGSPSSDPPTLAVSVAAQSGSDGYGGVGYLFSPSTVNLLLGGTVTWNNSSGDAHTVTIGGVSNPLGNGTQYVQTFNAAGNFPFSCSLHAGMSGTVNVTSP